MRNSNRYILVSLLSFLLIFSSVVPLAGVQAEGDVVEDVTNVGDLLEPEITEGNNQQEEVGLVQNFQLLVPEGYETYHFSGEINLLNREQSNEFLSVEEFLDLKNGSLDEDTEYFLNITIKLRNSEGNKINYLYREKLDGNEIKNLNNVNVSEDEVNRLQIHMNEEFNNELITLVVLGSDEYSVEVDKYDFNNNSQVELWLPSNLNNFLVKYVGNDYSNEISDAFYIVKEIDISNIDLNTPITFDEEFNNLVDVVFDRDLPHVSFIDYGISRSFRNIDRVSVSPGERFISAMLYGNNFFSSWSTDIIDFQFQTELSFSDTMNLEIDVYYNFLSHAISLKNDIQSGDFDLDWVDSENISHSFMIKNQDTDDIYKLEEEWGSYLLIDDLVLPPGNYVYFVEVEFEGQTLEQSVDFTIGEGRVYPNVSADDENNVILNADTSMEYSADGGISWLQYDDSNRPTFNGDQEVLVRYKNLTSYIIVFFTKNNDETGDFKFNLPSGFEEYEVSLNSGIVRSFGNGVSSKGFRSFDEFNDVRLDLEENEDHWIEMAFELKSDAGEIIIYLYQANLAGQEINDLEEINIDESEVIELQIEPHNKLNHHRITVISDQNFGFSIEEVLFNESGIMLWLPKEISKFYLKYSAQTELEDDLSQQVLLFKEVDLSVYESPIHFDNELKEAVEISFYRNNQPLDIDYLAMDHYSASFFSFPEFKQNTIILTPDLVRFFIEERQGDYIWKWYSKEIDIVENTQLQLTDLIEMDVSFSYLSNEIKFEHNIKGSQFNLHNVVSDRNSDSAISSLIEIKNVNKEIVFEDTLDFDYPGGIFYEIPYDSLPSGNYEYNVAIHVPGQEPLQESAWFQFDTLGTSSAPINMRAITSNLEIELTWESNVNNNAPTGYVVKRSEAEGGPYEDIAELNSSETIINSDGVTGTTHYIDTDIESDTTYHYIVTALNDVGEGIPSNEISAMVESDEDNDGSDDEDSDGGDSGESTPSGGSGGGSAPPPADVEETKSTEQEESEEELDDSKSVEVDVAKEAKTEEQADGSTKTKIELDERTINKALEDVDEVEQLVIDLSTVETDGLDIELSSDIIDSVTDKNDEVVIEIIMDEAAYHLPIEEIDLKDISKELGVSANELKVSIQINKVKNTELIEDQDELDLASDVYDFHIEVTSGDETVEIEHFSQYIERVIMGEKRFDPNRSIAVRLNEDGTFTPIPTVFNGKEAIIKSTSNSKYVIVENKVSFEDSEGWYQTTIEKLSSKYIINGISDTKFAPNEVTTRAQLAAMLVRSLDLKSNKDYSSIFTDVEGTEWFVNELNAAVEAGIVKGYNDNTFKPNDLITREQAAAMIYRAMALVQFDESKLNQSLIAKDKFSDYAEISKWAIEELEVMTQTGIIGGKTENMIAPSANATRAEVAVMIARFLQFVDFMN
ncbi:DUF4073 domain-containing protein [Chengkuizengella sp. SCS-71B]|uniref:DUF4073 domain-containing protein n=1 Tax=Chengkuizengella sp. SCS-71B TaxID=3115290 RepID=UPI0032C24ADE